MQDQDAIDFTDNDITAISNFPFSPRLHTLLLARNRVNSIQANLATSMPNLTALVLTSNNFAELADLDPLRHFSQLTHLVLIENPVTRREVCIVGLVTGVEALTTAFTALPILDNMALPHGPLPRLPKSQRR